MTPERWTRIEEIFQSAADLPTAARDAYLDRVCGGDAALRLEVASLLAESESAEDLPSLGLRSGRLLTHALASGARIGDFEILALVGAGGMGEVYRARDTRLERDVAIKVLPRDVSADPDRLGRFQREARVLASLNHPNIGAIYGIEEVAGISALVLELVVGETLAERIARGPVPIPEAVAIARQIADALEAAHEKGIVHRDLKPTNVAITSDGSVKVLDFGLAKLTRPPVPDPPSAVSDTGEGAIRLGTAAYMSPEQARSQTVDRRTDVWAFGCVLYEMLTGDRPFPGPTSPDVIAAVLAREPAWHALPEGTPASVRRLLRRALEKDPKRRLHDVADGRLELDEASEPTVSAVKHANDGATVRPIRRLVAGGLFVGMLALGGFVALYVRHVPSEPMPVAFEVATPPTDEPMSFALSPDGRQLAFVASMDDQERLWVRPLTQTQASPLPGTERAMMPFWSPDGRAIGFFANGKLKRVDVAGGVPQVIADAPEPRGGAWNRDGVIVFAPFTTGDLMAVRVADGQTVRTTAHGRWPQFLPDGRRFLYFYFVGPESSATQGVYVGSLDGGPPAFVMPSESAAMYAPADHLMLAREGRLLVWRFDPVRGIISGDPVEVARHLGSDGRLGPGFSVAGTSAVAQRSASAQRRQFVWVDRAGRTLDVVIKPDETILAHPELSPDATHVAFQRYQQGNNDIWLVDLVRGVATQFTTDRGIFPVWTRDGRDIIYANSTRLFKRSIAGTRQQTLPLDDPSLTAFDVSLDGRFLLYGLHTPSNGSDLWALALDGTAKRFPIVQTRGDDTSGQFSPDGRWILYQSDVSGRNEIYLQPVDSVGQRLQISASGGIWPRWRADGKEVFYVGTDDQLTAVPMTVGSGSEMPQPGVPTVLFQTRFATGGNVARFGGKAKAQYSVAADGRFLMNVAADAPTTPPITIVLNWTSATAR